MKNQSVAWKVNGLPLPKNPSTFIVNPDKIVDYRRAVHGEEIRVVPSKNAVDKYISVSWQYLDEDTRNLFYDLFVRDEKFRLETHLDSLYTNEYLVKIDEYNEDYLNSREPRWHVSMELRVLDGINDPIVRQGYKQTPHLFVVENNTNSTIYNANIFLTPKNVIRNPRITQTFWNLLTNPGFEDIDGQKPLGWVDPNGAWRVDIINFFEGQRCVGTSTPNSPIYQEVWCPGGESLTVMFATLGLPGGGKVKATLEYLNSSDAVIKEYSETVDAPGDHQTHWFSTSEPTPPETRKVRLKFEKASQDSSYIIIDMVMLRLGASEREPTWTNDRHRTLIYPNSLVRGETLDINLGLQVATKHGFGTTLPRGGSVFHFDDSFVSQDGIQPEDGYVASLRPNEGKFGGAVAVEEGTENYWRAHSGTTNGAVTNFDDSKNSMTFTVNASPSTDYAHLHHSGSSAIQLQDGVYTLSFEVRCVSGHTVQIAPYLNLVGDASQIGPSTPVSGQWVRIHQTKDLVSGAYQRATFAVTNAMRVPGAVLEVRHLQLEAKPFATSFVDGTRPDGFLAYKKHLSITEGFTVRLYARRVN